MLKVLEVNMTEKREHFSCEHCRPICNSCAKPVEFGYVITHAWGYFSTGKDGDRDHLVLCDECISKFEEETESYCGFCHKSISEVAADLLSRNMGSSFYGNKEQAALYIKKNPYFEYATIKGRIICEICYEEFLGRCKKPVEISDYDYGNYYESSYELPPPTKPKGNRIDAHFKWAKEKYSKIESSNNDIGVTD